MHVYGCIVRGREFTSDMWMTTMEWILILLIALIVVGVMSKGHESKQTATRHWKNEDDWEHCAEDLDDTEDRGVSEDVDQLSVVSATAFEVNRVMKPQEAHVFYKIENWVLDRNKGERVFVQVAMGSFLKAPNDAHRLINCKRPDYVIVDRSGWPLCVVEYQGGGHFQGDAKMRDLIKKAALEKANIPLVEIFEHEKDDKHLIWRKLNAAVEDITPAMS
jgi:hypothetical protein